MPAAHGHLHVVKYLGEKLLCSLLENAIATSSSNTDGKFSIYGGALAVNQVFDDVEMALGSRHCLKDASVSVDAAPEMLLQSSQTMLEAAHIHTTTHGPGNRFAMTDRQEDGSDDKEHESKGDADVRKENGDDAHLAAGVRCHDL